MCCLGYISHWGGLARQCGMTPAIYRTTIHQGGIDNCPYLNQTHHTQPQIPVDEYIITVNSYISNDVTTIVHMTYLNTNTETHSIWGFLQFPLYQSCFRSFYTRLTDGMCSSFILQDRSFGLNRPRTAPDEAHSGWNRGRAVSSICVIQYDIWTPSTC